MGDSIGGPEGKLDSETARDMTRKTAHEGVPETSGDGAWPEVLDKLIHGVTHQISNRVATLSGVSDILAGDESIPPVLRALADEVPKLEASIRLLRLLAAPEGEGEEALEAPRLVDDALALARVHPDCKEVAFSAPNGRDVPPVVARPTALMHEVLVALVRAASEVVSDGMTDGGSAVAVDYLVDGDELVISAGSYPVRARTLVAARRS